MGQNTYTPAGFTRTWAAGAFSLAEFSAMVRQTLTDAGFINTVSDAGPDNAVDDWVARGSVSGLPCDVARFRLFHQGGAQNRLRIATIYGGDDADATGSFTNPAEVMGLILSTTRDAIVPSTNYGHQGAVGGSVRGYCYADASTGTFWAAREEEAVGVGGFGKSPEVFGCFPVRRSVGNLSDKIPHFCLFAPLNGQVDFPRAFVIGQGPVDTLPAYYSTGASGGKYRNGVQDHFGISAIGSAYNNGYGLKSAGFPEADLAGYYPIFPAVYSPYVTKIVYDGQHPAAMVPFGEIMGTYAAKADMYADATAPAPGLIALVSGTYGAAVLPAPVGGFATHV